MAEAVPAGPCSLTLDRVTFGYEPGVPVLHELSLAVVAGETVCIVGPTGAGKSTLLSLSLRLYDPAEGAVLLAGRDLRRLSLRSLRRRVAVVPQDAWILDGFPRTLPQAEALDKSLSGAAALSHVIYFAVPEAVLVGRLSGRRTCSKCGAIWHLENRPTKKAGVCDQCGSELVQRSDDRPEAIGKRLEVYRSQTAPLLAYYRDRRVLREIDASRSPDLVFQELLKLMQ